MPIIVRDFEWEETETHVYISVPLKGIKVINVDVILCPNYLKVSFPPHLFECFLYADVDDVESSSHVSDGMIVFRLIKSQPTLWNQLQIADFKSKASDIRNDSMVYYQKKLQENAQLKSENKRKNAKFALNEMMKIENCEKMRIQKIKDHEIHKVNEEMEEWKKQQLINAEIEKKRISQEKKAASHLSKRSNNEHQQRIFDESPEVVEHSKRNSGTIEVNFTPRVFPTPVRESVTPQEEEWLKKQSEMRKIKEVLDSDLREEEKNPLWLRDKGNSFYNTGDWHSAINAYSLAIRLGSQMPSLYSNRAACHMKIGNYIKCIEDSSKALDYLTPPVPQNAMSRCKAHVRRGTAFCQLELYVEGLHDYEAALKLHPDNQILRNDAEKIRHIIEGRPDT